MSTWQADFYRRPLLDAAGNPLWELVVCDAAGTRLAIALCPQAAVTAAWLADQFKAIDSPLPECIQVFRPQSVSLLERACQRLGIALETTRHTPALKRLLQQRASEYAQLPEYQPQPYDPLKLEQPPPLPLPENLWGEQWRFAAIAAGEFWAALGDRPIPLRSLPEEWLPLNRGLASTTPLPGVIIDGGRQSMRLARWLAEVRPVALQFIAGEPDGLILEAGLSDRWVLTTFEDAEVRRAAQTFQQRQQNTQGLHFLLVQPDPSGVTYTGLWLLQTPQEP